MNEKENDTKQFHLRRLLSSMECRISISRIGDKPVRTKYALVQMTHLQTRALHFVSPLKLPCSEHITYTFELLMDGTIWMFTGNRLEKNGETAPYRYSTEYDLGPGERTVLFWAINQRLESSYPLMSKAIESYSSFGSYNQSTPYGYFQNTIAMNC